MTLQERKDKMLALRKEGYNCAQSLIMCFPDITGFDDDTVARLTAGLGSGVGAMGEICGAANAMALIAGTRFSSSATDKGPAAKEVNALCRIFADTNGGRITCRDLKGKPGIRPCNALIEQAIEILHSRYCQQ